MQDQETNLQKIKFSTWKQVLKVVLNNKKKLILLLIFAVFLAILDTIIPLINSYAIALFIESKDVTHEQVLYNFDHYFIYLVIINLVVAFAFGLVVYGFIYQGSIIEAEVNYDLRELTFKRLQELSFSYYDNTPQGAIMSRMTSDTRRLAEVISWGVIDLVWSVLLMIFTLIVLYIHSWRLALVVTASLPLMFLVTKIFRKRVLKAHRKSRKINSQLTSLYNESFLGASTSKSLVIEENNLNEFIYESKLMKKASIKAISISALFSTVLLIICYVIVGITMIFGTYLTIGDNALLTIPILYLFIRSTVGFFDPIMSLTSFISQLQQAQASAERIVELIETKPAIVDSEEVVNKYGDWFSHKKENWEEIKGDIQFSNVNFHYKEGEPILQDFNLKIEHGTKVALVGHTGSGKTTIVNLLSRFYEPVSGEILIDNIDYKERSISWLHKQIGYVLQTPHLFSTSIFENIRYGNLDATDEEIIKVCKDIGIHDFIMNLQNGYDTQVGETGNNLSLGQKQLISFARAIIANPKILILDEATSSIDSKAEILIQKATEKLLKGKTSFIVAHRLSTIVDSDLIILMENGKIKEMGSHKELLSNRGDYFNLYKNQFMKEQEELSIINVLQEA